MDAGGRVENKKKDKLKLKFLPKGFIDFQAPHHVLLQSRFPLPFVTPS
jgi:hypothetical protein